MPLSEATPNRPETPAPSACPNPRGQYDHNANRSPDLASSYLKRLLTAWPQWLQQNAACFVVCFTVSGKVRESHPVPMTGGFLRSAACFHADAPAIHLSDPLYARRRETSIYAGNGAGREE